MAEVLRLRSDSVQDVAALASQVTSLVVWTAMLPPHLTPKQIHEAATFFPGGHKEMRTSVQVLVLYCARDHVRRVTGVLGLGSR